MSLTFIHDAEWVDLNEKRRIMTDVQIKDGRILDIGHNLQPVEGSFIIEGEGMLMTVGWIDEHAHLEHFPGAAGIDPDGQLKNGVTMMIDAGSAGPDNYEEFIKVDLEDRKMPVKTLLNLAPTGIGKAELKCLADVDVDKCAAMVEKHRDKIIGVKLRIDTRVCENSLKAMELIRELSDRTGLPVTVHPSRSEASMEDILASMKAGDIFAHIYAAMAPGLLTEDGQVKPAVWEARKRGILFDLAHGNNNFNLAVAHKAFDQGFYPDIISTDLHARSIGKVQSLAMTMTKAMHCGMDLYDVLEKVTVAPVRYLGIRDKATEIKVGEKADLVLFRVSRGQFPVTDSTLNEEIAGEMIQPCFTLLGEDIYPAEEEDKA